ncbi:hypothetical protein ACFWNL_09415 [Kitasatospora sp. NPDC058397]|uniref:hypothetical protein n=1 Tax=unclassified Kitasatospora TaxID=2633591 RepID=UPI003650B031
MTDQTPAAAQPVQFPLTETFTRSAPDNPHWKLLGPVQLNGGLELAPQPGTAATAFLDQPFSSALGVTIDFDYANTGPDTALDGLSVYLIDGAQTTELGGPAGSLGYSSHHHPSGGDERAGVTAGWVGIGFDNGGYFAHVAAGPGGADSRPDTLTVRGSGSAMSGFDWRTGVEVPGGFRATWEEGAHLQVSVIAGRLTVRRSSKSNPQGSLLIDDFDLAGQAGQAAMPATFKLGFGASSLGQSAFQIRNLSVELPADMPLVMSGPQSAKAGERVAYTFEVQNLGPNDAPDARVEGLIPGPLQATAQLSCRGENGAECGYGSVVGGLHQLVSLPRGGKAVITLSGTIGRHAEGRMAVTGQVQSRTRTNTAARQAGSVDTDVELPRVAVASQITGQWPQSSPEGANGWVVSYDLTLAANEQRVAAWEISFSVPANTRVNPTQTSWYQVLKDGLDGQTVIMSPDGSHTIDPGQSLTVNVQMLYPSQTEAGDGSLRNLIAIELAHP